MARKKTRRSKVGRLRIRYRGKLRLAYVFYNPRNGVTYKAIKLKNGRFRIIGSIGGRR